MSFPVSDCDAIYQDIKGYDIIIENGTEDNIYVFDKINKFKEAIQNSIINSKTNYSNNNSINSDSFITLNDLTRLTLYKRRKL